MAGFTGIGIVAEILIGLVIAFIAIKIVIRINECRVRHTSYKRYFRTMEGVAVDPITARYGPRTPLPAITYEPQGDGKVTFKSVKTALKSDKTSKKATKSEAVDLSPEL